MEKNRMIRTWTIDTCVMYEIGKNNSDAITLLMLIKRKNDFIAFDFEGNIEREYRTCLKRISLCRDCFPGYDFLCEQLKYIIDRLATKFSSKINRKQKETLLNKHFFDPDDLVFVSVCNSTNWKKLISEDHKHYSEGTKKYLKEKMGIDVFSINNSTSHEFWS